jgi:hypothetical protein
MAFPGDLRSQRSRDAPQIVPVAVETDFTKWVDDIDAAAGEVQVQPCIYQSL